MKSNLFKPILFGSALMLGANTNVFAGKVTIKVFKSDGTPLENASIKYENGGGGVSTLSQISTGVAEKNLTGTGYHKFSVAYKGMGFLCPTITTAGSASGGDTTIELYTTGVTYKATSGTTNIAGVGLRYTAGGSVSNQPGTTNASGEYKIEMLPGTYTHNATLNYITQALPITINGTVIGSATTQTVNIPVSKVNFHNAGTVKHTVSGSVDRTITSDYYLVSGTYNLRFKTGSNPTYKRNVIISGANFDRVAAVIRLKDHNGDALSINSIRGGNGSSIAWHVSGVNNGYHVAEGDSSVWIDISPYTSSTNFRNYEVTKNGTINTISQDMTANNIVDFATHLLTVRLQKCGGVGISGGTMRVGSTSDTSASSVSINRHWTQMVVSSGATDSDGESSVEVFPSKFIVEMKTMNTTQNKTFVVAGNHTETWTTTNVKFNYPGAIAYGYSSISNHFPATKEAEMFPGAFKFRFSTAGTSTAAFPSSSNIISINIPNQCSYSVTPVITRFVNSSNAPITTGNASYQHTTGALVASIASDVSGNYVSLIPGVVTGNKNFYIDYTGKRISQTANITTANNKVLFQTVSPVVHFNTSTGGDQTGTAYYQEMGGAMKVFGNSNFTGSTTMEILPTTYNVRINHNSKSIVKTVNFATTHDVYFNTEAITVHFNTSTGGDQTGTAYYQEMGGAMKVFGDAGFAGSTTMEMLPTTYNVRINHNSKSIVKTVDFATTHDVYFKTAKVDFDATTDCDPLTDKYVRYQESSGAIKNIGKTDVDGNLSAEFLPVGFNFSMVNGTTKTVSFTPTLDATNNVSFKFGTCSVAMRKTNETLDVESAKTLVSVYPTLAQETVNVSLPTGNGTLNVYSITGQHIMSQELNKGITSLNISHLAQGSYIAIVLHDGQTTKVKFTKQ